jgi:hypothetical protein
LIVALRPDEATELALRAALTSDIDVAVVPYCVFTARRGEEKQVVKEWST